LKADSCPVFLAIDEAEYPACIHPVMRGRANGIHQLPSLSGFSEMPIVGLA
jgi:hypothetical protein